MPTGKVSFYDDCRGYGFIISDAGGPDVFVHAKHIMNADMLKKDQPVVFDVVMDQSRGKQRADRVRVIDRTIALDNDFLLNVD